MTTHKSTIDAQISAIISAYNDELQSIVNNHKIASDLCYANYLDALKDGKDNALALLMYNENLLSIDNAFESAIYKNSTKLDKAIAKLASSHA